MRYWRFIIFGLALVFLIYYFAVYQDGKKERQQSAQTGQEQGVVKQWETKTDEQEPVLIKVTPTQLEKDAKEWKFNITFTTHSVELDLDPTQIAVLVNDKGASFKPTGWEGPGPGGHHREGILIFNPIQPIPQYIKLIIRDVGGIPQRSLRWDLE